MHKTIVAAAAVLLTGAGACLAQPPGITREMIERSLPLEGAPLAEPGPYKVTSEPAFGSPGLHVFRPATLDAFPKKDTLPVMVWGNGGCAIDSTRYSGFLTTIASHGFLVVGTVPQEGAARRQETADDMRAAIDWAEKENARAGSPLERQDRHWTKSRSWASRAEDFSRSRSAPIPASKPSACSIPACRNRRPALRRRRSHCGRPAQTARAGAADQRQRPRLHDGDVGGDVRHDQQRAGVLRRAAQRRPHRDRLSSRRRRVRQCRVELAAVDASKATRKPARCSSARTAASARIRTGM